MMTTLAGIPATLTPLAEPLSQLTGFSLEAVWPQDVGHERSALYLARLQRVPPNGTNHENSERRHWYLFAKPD